MNIMQICRSGHGSSRRGLWATLTGRGRTSRRAGWAILTAAVLAACGGGVGELVAIAIVTPLGGSWSANGGNETIEFTVPLQTEVFASKFDMDVSLTTAVATDVCGKFTGNPQLAGSLNNGNLAVHQVGVASNCLTGKFSDLITLDAVAGPTNLRYRNTRVAVNLDVGLWISDANQLKLKFTAPASVDNDTSVANNDAADVTGCDVSGGVVKFLGKMNGFDTNTNAKPLIPEIRSNPGNVLLFTQIVFVDGATLTLVNSMGQSVTLHRRADATTTCPP